MQRLYALCGRLAESDVPVIIEGETGSGKEALAESLHAASARADHPFVVFDCMALSPRLIESSLFGHEAGDPTAGSKARPGVFEEASGGTLLIDEIAELAPDLQAKLLRVLERNEVRAVGATKSTSVDVRIMATSRRPLDEEVKAGRFRDDLFFRLAVTRISVPPLREREEDIPMLAEHFWRTLAGTNAAPPAGLLEPFAGHGWPGNVRELKNAIARRVALGELADEGGVMLGDKPAGESTTSGPRPPVDDPFAAILAMDLPLPLARQRLVSDFERHYIARVLTLHEGDIEAAAKASGVAHRYFELLCARLDRSPETDQ